MICLEDLEQATPPVVTSGRVNATPV